MWSSGREETDGKNGMEGAREAVQSMESGQGAWRIGLDFLSSRNEMARGSVGIMRIVVILSHWPA